MKYIFISDLHLSPQTIVANNIFYSLLAKWCGKINALYILGDFFDYWVGDDDNNPFIEQIKNELYEFSRHTPIYFIAGNHDFMIGKKFCNQTGIKLLKDCSIIKLPIKTNNSISNQKIVLAHGDSFCTLDVGYQKMKKILRNPILMAIYRKLSLKLRYAIKEKIEQKSHKHANNKPAQTYNVVDQSIVEYCLKHNANIIIHGHTHNPGKYLIEGPQTSTITRVEIPDWREHKAGGYVTINQQGDIEIMQSDQ